MITALWKPVRAQQAVTNPSHSIARIWNEALLSAIRNDLARPTVHARNLFHSAVVTYDAWAVFATDKSLWMLNRTQQSGSSCSFPQTVRENYKALPTDMNQNRREVISYANYRLFTHRFSSSPGAATTLSRFDAIMDELGYDTALTSTDLGSVSLAALGNYLAQCMIDHGYQDGSNEQENYVNRYYQTVNPPLDPTSSNPSISDPNRWQSLMLDTFIDQSGIETTTPEFLSAEWGNVSGFALSADDRTIYQRDGNQFPGYHDPGPPALFSSTYDGGTGRTTEYSWGHSLVALWSAHLDPADGVMIDISPATLGNGQVLPSTLGELRDIYDDLEGGADDLGYAVNPATSEPYETNPVLRGDYTRVLAEFWADGPDSETPPGHWFSIYNEAVIAR